MRFSHVDHMRNRLHGVFLQLIGEDGFTVAIIAGLAGCSESLVYQWTQGKSSPQGPYLAALAFRLASEYHNYRLLATMVPPGVRLARVQIETQANGCLLDEYADLGLAAANALVSHQGNDPDGIAAARAELRAVERRMEAEENALRANREG